MSLIPRFIDQSIKWQNNMVEAHESDRSINQSINQLIDEQEDSQSLLERLTKAIRSSNQSTAINQSLSTDSFESLAKSFNEASNKQTQWKNEVIRAKYIVLPVVQTVLNKLDGADKVCQEDDEMLRQIVRESHISWYNA